MPSFKVIGLIAPEKKILKVLTYMGMVAILVMRPGPLNNLSFPYPKEAPHEIWFQSPYWLLSKRSLKILTPRDLDQGQWMTLTFGTHKASCTHLVDCIYQLLYYIDYNSFLKNPLFNFFQKKKGTKFDLSVK